MTNIDFPSPIRAELLTIHVFAGPSKRIFSRKGADESDRLIVVTGGCYQAHLDDGAGRHTVRAWPGDIVYWPFSAQRVEESIPKSPLKCISIYLRWPGAPYPLIPCVRDRHLLIHVLATRLLALAHDPVRRALMPRVGETYLNAMLAEYLTLAEAVETDLESIVARYTEHHMRDPIRLSDLAQYTGLSVPYFSRLYKQQTGRTPIQDVHQRKAAHAKMSMLQHPSRRLRQIAVLVGIRDSETLCRLLKRHAGMTAREIRRIARGTETPPNIARLPATTVTEPQGIACTGLNGSANCNRSRACATCGDRRHINI